MDRKIKFTRRFRRLILCSLWLVLFLVPSPLRAQTKPEQPVKVTTCQLKKNPRLYNHRLVEVTTLFSNAFEGHMLVDPNCSGWSGTWYTFSLTPEVIENVRITLVKDARFREFASFMKHHPQTLTRATFVGRFFSGEKKTSRNGEYWGGYGHFGCCSLLAIQQVVDIDLKRSPDFDYGASVDQPNIDKPGCGYTFLTDVEEPGQELIKAQVDAEQSQNEWMFNDPKRVATNGLAKILFIDQDEIALRQTKHAAGRFVYQWHPKARKESYMVVVSRPYWLAPYAKDQTRIPWVVIGAFEVACDNRRSVTRIR